MVVILVFIKYYLMERRNENEKVVIWQWQWLSRRYPCGCRWSW
jgi:hypothetical protein